LAASLSLSMTARMVSLLAHESKNLLFHLLLLALQIIDFSHHFKDDLLVIHKIVEPVIEALSENGVISNQVLLKEIGNADLTQSCPTIGATHL
jgi:hypothetical protein